jgi:putative acetyltransferase
MDPLAIRTGLRRVAFSGQHLRVERPDGGRSRPAIWRQFAGDARIELVLPSDATVIRSENGGDRSSVRSVHEAAFGRPDEADLVERLWSGGAVLVSLVAEVRRQIVGHILFSRMSIDTARAPIAAVALGPMAVLPEYQGRGIGGQLIRRGLKLLFEQGEHIVLVLGHADYYPRFGFSTKKASSLESPFLPSAFMAMELIPGALDGVCGKVRYPAAFGCEPNTGPLERVTR